MPVAAPSPSTPPRSARRRSLKQVLSDPVTPAPVQRGKRALSNPAVEKEVKKVRAPPVAAPAAAVAAPSSEMAAARAERERQEAALASTVEEFCDDFDQVAMPMDTRRRLAPIFQRWGKARAAQILGLWTFLGDGLSESRRVAASTLQVWGPPGTGKTAVVTDYLKTLGVRHIRLNCATFTTLGELNARLVELLRRTAVSAAGAQAGELPTSLHRSTPTGQQVRSLDKLETLARVPLQTLSRSNGDVGLLPVSDSAEAPVKVVVVVDQAQELPRLGAGSIEFLINLPEVLQWGNQLSLVVVGRLKLGSLGLHPNREPPAVVFQAYTEAEAESALNKVLAPEFSAAPCNASGSASSSRLAVTDICSGLMKFAWPHLGRNIDQLLSIARQLLQEGLPDVAGGSCGAAFQQLVLKAVQQRLGVCDLSGLLKKGEHVEGMDTASMSALITLKQMTKAEMRLILAAYLAGYVEKEDDMTLFMPEIRRKRRNKQSAKAAMADQLPIYVKAPRPTSMARLLAVYHRLARQPQLLGPPIFEHLAGLREAGLLRFPAERACLDQDVKVTCRAQLPLVRAIAGELNLDLAEYLTKY